MNNNEQSRKNSRLKQFLDDINTDYKQAVDEVQQELKQENKLDKNFETLDIEDTSNDTYQKDDLSDTNLYSKVNMQTNDFLDNFDNIKETPVEETNESTIATPLQVMPKQSNFETVIAKNTLIKGTVYSDDGIEVSGKVIGDIECKQDMLINGRVKGTTSSKNAEVVDAVIDGALSCSGDLFVNHNSWVVGNLKSFEAEVNGKIKGNINTRDTLLVGNDAIVMGDISTGELEIKKGAFVNGRINMYQASKEVIDTFENLIED